MYVRMYVCMYVCIHMIKCQTGCQIECQWNDRIDTPESTPEKIETIYWMPEYVPGRKSVRGDHSKKLSFLHGTSTFRRGLSDESLADTGARSSARFNTCEMQTYCCWA